MEIFIAFFLFTLVIVFIAIIYYNRIIKLKVQVNEGWSDVQVQLKRRHNLITNLIETVKGYATHEKETLEKVVQARSAAEQSAGKDMATIGGLEAQLTTALQGLKINALAEAYPDLKANTNFLQLQQELADTENKIAASRRFYNTTVTGLNTTIQQFPGNMFAKFAGATKADFFELDEDQKVAEVPQVDFKKDTDEAKKAGTIPAQAPAAPSILNAAKAAATAATTAATSAATAATNAASSAANAATGTPAPPAAGTPATPAAAPTTPPAAPATPPPAAPTTPPPAAATPPPAAAAPATPPPAAPETPPAADKK